jgi:hypothetical protein
MRNAWRVFAFDIAAPVAAICALLAIGVILGWPRWWVSVCSVLLLLIVQGVAVNVWLLRRDSVTVGTDDDAPGLRLAVVGLCTVALVSAVLTGYTHWTSNDRRLKADLAADSAEVVRIATAVTEATETFSPQEPTAAIDRAAAMMVPEQAKVFKDNSAKETADLLHQNVTMSAVTLESGVEGIGPSVARVAVILRATQNAPGQPPDNAVLALRVALTKQSDHWLVLTVLPINSR